MIHVLATVTLQEGHRADFLSIFHNLMPKVHAEQGCIEYGPAIDAETDIGTQMPRRENVVVIVEKWEGLDALKAHLQIAHMKEYREQVKDLVQGVELQILEPA